MAGTVRRFAAAAVMSVMGAGLGAVPALAGTSVAPTSPATAPYDVFTVDSPTSTFTFSQGAPTRVGFSLQDRTLTVAGSSLYPTGRTEHSFFLDLTPPTTDAQLTPGRTYDTARFADDTHAGLDLSGDGRGCNTAGGHVTVRDATYDGSGALTGLAASYDFTCEPGLPGEERSFGEVRWVSQIPFPAVDLPDVSAGHVVLDQTVDRVAGYRNVGTQPLSIAGVAITGAGAANWRVTSDACTGTLAPGATCDVGVSVTPSGTFSSSGTWDDGAQLIFTDDSPRGSHTAALNVNVDPVSAPIYVRMSVLLDMAKLSWRPGPGRAPTGYEIWRDDFTFSPGYKWADLPADSTHYTLGLLAGDTHYYRVVAKSSAGGANASSPPLSVPTPNGELIMTGNNGGATTPALLASSPGAASSGVADGTGTVTSPPALSPDGSQLVYAKSSGGAVDLWMASSSMLEPWCDSCGTFVHGVTDPAWSPTGAEIATTTASGSLLRYDVISRDTITVPGVGRAAQPSWLPDGSGLVVVDTAAGAPLRRVSLAGAVASVVGTGDGRHPAVSPRGDLVAYLAPVNDQWQLRTVPLSGSATPRSLLTGDLRHVSWSPDASALIVTQGTAGGSQIVSVDPVTGAQTTMFATTGQLTSAVLRVSDSTPPAITVNAPAATGAHATIPFSVVDDTTPVGGISITCSLDGKAAAGCQPPNWTGLVTAGTHTLTVAASDHGQTSTAQATWTADTSVPVAHMTAPSVASVLAASAAVGWAGTDTGTGLASFDTRYRSVTDRATTWSGYVYPAAWQRSVRSSQVLGLAPGTQYCLSVRARDKVGNVGAWSPERCVARPEDDRALTLATGGWVRGTSTAYYSGTYSRTGRYGAALTRTSVHARQVSVVAATCPTCGTVVVWLGGTRLGSISTYSATSRHKVVFTLPAQASVRTGTLLIRNVSAGRPVYIDAVSLRRA